MIGQRDTLPAHQNPIVVTECRQALDALRVQCHSSLSAGFVGR